MAAADSERTLRMFSKQPDNIDKMGSLKRSTFPAVLKQYLPDDEQSFSTPSGPSVCRCQTGAPQPARDQVKARLTATRRSRTSSRSPEPLVRESTSLQHRKQQLKRYRQNYENWQAAKLDLKQEAAHQLRVRIGVQQELIKQQEELAVRRHRDLEQRNATRREAEKELRQSQAEALQQVCRESLNADRQKAQDERRTQREMSKHGGSKDSLASSQTSYGIPTPRPGEGEPTHVSTLKLTVRRPQQSSLLSLPAYPSMVAEEEEEEDKAAQEQHEEQPQEEAELGEQLPWHWEQLYKLYGRQANYFLKPRPDENERGRTVGDLVSPKNLRLIGRPGAGSLWRSLRGDSETKLLQQDREISQDLKAAYSAFVRQCLSKCKRPVKRNFSAEEDRGPKVTTMDDLWREQVPEMDRLLDQTRILSAHDYKHMVELMYRASTMNQDRTGILRYNNPPPNLNNWDGDESCGRYMPSWLPDYDEEEVEPEYRKWIKAKPKKEGRSSPSSSSSEQGQDNLPAMTTKMASTTVSLDAASDNQWRFLREIRPKTRKPKTPKYLFLTEEAATVPGQFSKQRKELLEARHIPAAFTQHPRTNTQSALAMVGENSTRRENDFSEATPSVTHAHTHAQFTSDWQPLSLEALVEYKQAVDALGQGNFNQGTVPRWSTVDIVEKAH